MLAAAAGLPLIAGTAVSVQGEVALWQDRPERAKADFERARDVFGEDPAREVAETDLHLAEAHRAAGDGGAGREALRRVEERLDELGDVDDLRARLALARARLDVDDGELATALEGFDEAASLARKAGQRELQAECHARSYRACQERGANTLAEEHAAAARRLWERTAVSLTPERASAYWRHPVRRLVPVLRGRAESATTGLKRREGRPPTLVLRSERAEVQHAVLPPLHCKALPNKALQADGPAEAESAPRDDVIA